MVPEVLDPCIGQTEILRSGVDHESEEEVRQRLEEWRTMAANLAGGFIQNPKAVLYDPTLSSNARLVYECLLGYMWDKEWCWPSQQTIADKLHISRRTVIRCCKELYERGFIEKWRRGLGHTNVYFINPLSFVKSTGITVKQITLCPPSEAEQAPDAPLASLYGVTFYANDPVCAVVTSGCQAETQRQAQELRGMKTKEKETQEKYRGSSSSTVSNPSPEDLLVGDESSISRKQSGEKAERVEDCGEAVKEVKDTIKGNELDKHSNTVKAVKGDTGSVAQEAPCVQAGKHAQPRTAGMVEKPSESQEQAVTQAQKHATSDTAGVSAAAQEPSQEQAARPKREIPATIGKIAAEYARQYDDAHLIRGDVTRMKKIYATAMQVYPELTEQEFWQRFDEAKLAAGKFAHKRKNSKGHVTRVPYFFTCLENLFSFTLEELVYLRSDHPLYADNTLIDVLETLVQTYNRQVTEQATVLQYGEWLQTVLDLMEHCTEPKQRNNPAYRDF